MKTSEFREMVLAWYRDHRRDFPWRETRDPWAILLSEVMLQQTQTQRVVPKYLAFLEAFPEPRALAAAPVSKLLALWSGLGYNRRALGLKRAAEEITSCFGGTVPSCEEELLSLPGIGPYTSAAVRAFAFGQAVVLLETNVRAAFIHHFFPDSSEVSDREILPLVAEALDRGDPRNWYYALMDYGSDLKRRLPNPGRRSLHHAKQSSFALSHRRVRGEVLKALSGESLTEGMLAQRLPFARERVEKAAAELVAEGFLERYGVELGLAGRLPIGSHGLGGD
ncbi:MAG: A/G-specific adenine glycosylase [Rectinemataceae bacterium]